MSDSLLLNHMVNYSLIDSTFTALADPTRRQMVEQLLRGDATISDLAAPHEMSMPAAMKHVRKLVDAGLVRREKKGRSVTCSLNIDPLDQASRWLHQHLEFWNQRLDALDRYLARQKEADK
jgi:DNA-binding transcriptional ArsR family regulator